MQSKETDADAGKSTLILQRGGETVETTEGDWLTISDSGVIRLGRVVNQGMLNEMNYPIRILSPVSWKDLKPTPRRLSRTDSETWTVELA